jgi:protoheme IX farnesyltransferase
MDNTAEISVALPRAWTHVAADFLALSKPRVVAMVLATTLVGFYLASTTPTEYWLLFKVLVGTGLAAGGTLALNQYLERDLDARMERTRGRPLPSGRLQPIDALVFGALTTVTGLAVLSLAVNPLSGVVTATIVTTYLFAYTPMKVRSPLCSLVGAIPGALPPVTGWVAARGELGTGAWVLFAILFLWQLPHSLAIAKLYASDYARAGFRLLPIVDAGGYSTERQVVGNCAALLVVGLMPTLLGVAGPHYFVAALVLGMGFLACGLRMAWARSASSARVVLLASLAYLPLLLAAMAADKVPF